MCSDGGMSDNDDIERLLRRSTPPPVERGFSLPRRPESSPVPTDKESKGGSALAVAAVIGVVGLVLGSILGFPPYIRDFLGLGGSGRLIA